MKIDLPVVEHMIRVLVNSPEGEFVKVLDGSHRSFEIDLPDSVLEDEVEVVACHLDVRGLAQGDVFYLKEAVVPEPTKEKDDEDAPVEADEEVAKSPPAESDHEKASDYPEKEVEVRELPAPHELGSVDLSKKTRKARMRRKSR